MVLFGASVVATPVKAQQFTYLGQVGLFGSNFCPSGWLKADGAILQISQNTALFALFGKTYGGDGTTTFGLPKIAVPTQNGGPLMACVAAQGMFPSR
jgi:microcystin-dependent protein